MISNSAFAAACRERGVRLTTQRLAVYRALAGDRTHPTAESLHERLSAEVPGLSLGSVYRILETLERHLLVRRVSTGGGATRFDARLDPHQHLVCRVCGSMADVILPDFRPPRLRSADFEVESVDLHLIGRCRRCRSGASKPTHRRRKP